MSILSLENELWYVIDSSKIQTAMECSRKYFFEYILGWRRKGSSIHLEFGRAMHKPFEVFNEKRKYEPGRMIEDEDIAEGFREFLKIYRETQPKEFDEDNIPKDPGTALDALVAYAQEYGARDAMEKVYFSETGGSVAISKDRVIHLKTDAVLENEKGIFVRDYKTSMRGGASWQNQWFQKFQIKTYLYGAMCMFDDVYGLEVRGIFVYKAHNKDREYSNIDFQDVMVRMTPDMLDEYLWLANDWYDKLFTEYDKLFANKGFEDDVVMRAFPKNPESCNNWGGCPYLDLCNSWSNPAQKWDRLPGGFEVHEWDPRTEIKDTKAEFIVQDGKGTIIDRGKK